MTSRGPAPRPAGGPPGRLPLCRRLAFAAAAVLLGLALLEGVARLVEVWNPPRVVDLGLGFDDASRLFETPPGLPGRRTTARAKIGPFRPQAFDAEKPVGTLRVVALGGSSVNFADKELRVLEARLAREFAADWRDAELINCGGMGYGSHRIQLVAMEMLGYDPDVVLLYEAHNEFEEIDQLRFASLETLTVQRALSKSAFVRVIGDLAIAREEERLRREHEEQRALLHVPPEAGMPLAWDRAFTRDEIDARMRAFRDRHAVILEACRTRGVGVVLCTVPSNLVNPAFAGDGWKAYEPVKELLRQGRHADAVALGRRLLRASGTRHQSSDLENAILRDLAAEYRVPLADVEAAVCAAEPHGVPGETLFTDHCHLSEKGNAILRETVEKAMLPLLRERAAARRAAGPGAVPGGR